jgi:hypothetical protein
MDGGVKLGAHRIQIKNITVIGDRTACSQGVADEFAKASVKKSTGVLIVSRQYTTHKAADFASIPTAIKPNIPTWFSWAARCCARCASWASAPNTWGRWPLFDRTGSPGRRRFGRQARIDQRAEIIPGAMPESQL